MTEKNTETTSKEIVEAARQLADAQAHLDKVREDAERKRKTKPVTKQEQDDALVSLRGELIDRIEELEKKLKSKTVIVSDNDGDYISPFYRRKYFW